MSYNRHSAASSVPSPHNSSRRPRKRLQSRDNSDIVVLDREKKHNQQTSESRPNDDRRQSWLGIPKDIFKRQSLQLSNSYNFKNSSGTKPITIDNSAKNVNIHTSPNSFAARSARNRLAVASMAHDTAPTAMPQTSEPPQLHPYADSILSLDQSSICRSPTWGDEKSKKKQTGWTWGKSSDSKPKQEQEHNSVVKQSNRLNKKPPPAMETQRHSAPLANGVITEAPPMERRRSSSSGSFTHAMRGFLSRRSSQTNTPETSRPASRSRPQSSSQEPKVRELSHKLSFDRTRQENETYTSDNAKVGTQKVASSRGHTRRTTPQEISPAQASIGPVPLSTPPQSSGGESKGPTPPPKSANDLSRATPRPTSIARMFGKRDNAAGGYKYPGRNKLTREHKSRSDVNPNSNTWLSQNSNHFRGNSAAEISQENASSQSVGGYVERERRVHQQRSIARFQDEIAVKSAYDQFITESQLPPTPQDSSESVLVARTEPTQELRHQPISRLGQENHHSLVEPTVSNSGPHQKLAQPLQAYPGQNPDTRSGPEKTSSTSWSPKNDTRPGPGVIQLAKFAPRNQSLPTIPQQGRYQSADSQRQSKESAARATSALTNASDSGVVSYNTPSTYQLPPISTSTTSPILSAFLDQSIVAQPPFALNLNNNIIQTNATTTRIPAPVNPAPEVRTLGSKKKTELLIASENAEGLTRKTSVKKSRSDPELKVPELKIDPPPPSDLPSLDFLPELKHQPLTKPKRTSRVSFAPGSPPAPLSPSQFPIPSPTTEVARRGVTGLRTTKWSSISNSALIGTDAGPPKPIAKMFVICCKCKFWHDLPSKIYEAMALPQAVGKEDDIATDIQHQKGGKPNQAGPPDEQVKGLEGKIFTQVKCPWCEHGMSTNCCAGWTAVIYLHERHH